MTPEARAKALLPKLLVTSDATIRAAHEILLATALREAEQSAFERAAKVADEAGVVTTGTVSLQAQWIANAIRNLVKPSPMRSGERT